VEKRILKFISSGWEQFKCLGVRGAVSRVCLAADSDCQSLYISVIKKDEFVFAVCTRRLVAFIIKSRSI